MGVIDWKCCNCYHEFQAHSNKCPACGHWINWSHTHQAIQVKRKPKQTLWQSYLNGLYHIYHNFVKH